MLTALLRHADKFVYVSSVHAIAIPREGGVITETKVFDPGKVIGDYARTKCEATAYVLSRTDYMDITIVHPSGIIGPYDLGRNDLVALVDSIINGRRYTGVRGGYDMVLLNAKLAQISEKIYFSYEPAQNPDALYCEPTMGGFVNLIQNANGLDSKVNIEALFDAFHTNKGLFTEIFSNVQSLNSESNE